MLVFDSCALLHARQLGPPLGRIQQLVSALRMPVLATARLRQEQEAMTLREIFMEMGVQTQHVTAQVVKEALNQVERRRVAGRRVALPGREDQYAVTLAWKRQAALLTHDDKARMMAEALRVPCADIIDLVLYSTELGLCDREGAALAFTHLRSGEGPPFAWQPPEWRNGSPSSEDILSLAETRERSALKEIFASYTEEL